MGAEQEGPNQETTAAIRAETLPEVEDIFNKDFLKRIQRKKTEAGIAELRRLLTEEGIRQRVQTMTNFVLTEMPLQKGDHFRFDELLKPAEGELETADSVTIWQALDTRRTQIGVDEVGKILGININQEAHRLRSDIHAKTTEENRRSFPTNNPLFDIRIRYMQEELEQNDGFRYEFVKNKD